MNKYLKGLLILLVGCFIAGNAFAVPFVFGPGTPGEASLQTVLNNITVGPNPGVSGVNTLTDSLSDVSDSYWNITGSGGSISTMVIEITAGSSTNTFGVFNGNNFVQLFDGAAGTGTQTSLGLLDNMDGTYSVYKNFADTGVDFNGFTFGYYLGVGENKLYSDSLLNTLEFDAMLAYQGNGDTVKIGGWAPGIWTANEYILAFEDGLDGDYQDFVVMVESVSPVPEPATMMLLGLGLLGLAGVSRKRR